MLGFSFGLVSRLLKNRFQFCLRTTSVSRFQFRFEFHPKKLFYFKYGLCKCSTFERFCCIAMISSNSDGRVRRAIASKIVDLGIIPNPVKPKTQKLVFTASVFDAQHQRNRSGMMVMTILKPKTLENSEQVLISVLVLTFREKTVSV